jgi:hypothetical protein
VTWLVWDESRSVARRSSRRPEACRRVGKDAHAVAAVARDFGVGWATVMRAVAEHGSPLVDDATRLEGVTALGLDETSFLKATRVAPTRYVTGLVDLERGRGLARAGDSEGQQGITNLEVSGPFGAMYLGPETAGVHFHMVAAQCPGLDSGAPRLCADGETGATTSTSISEPRGFTAIAHYYPVGGVS